MNTANPIGSGAKTFTYKKPKNITSIELKAYIKLFQTHESNN
jgi:hypothetical protein